MAQPLPDRVVGDGRTIDDPRRRRQGRPLEVLLPPAERDRIRAEVLARAPRWYNPWAHLAVPSVFGIGVIVVAALLLRDPGGWELLTVPVVYLLTNMNEWYIHRDLLHRRNPLAKVLYDRHTPEHHMIYVTDDMAMRERREFRLVLIPAYGLFLIFVNLLPITAALWFLLGRNVALLYTATAMGYAVSYEWLHLSYHLPATSRIGRSRLIRRLRRHHAVHHDPRLMQRWNFNVTLPLWDWVRGTIVKEA
ncbi:MAG: sterol desaturase family protein [Candidatus Binatia bacterium]